MPGTWLHLTGRFFDVVTARPLDGGELDRLRRWLAPGELALFSAQDHADQRHGYECALDVASLLPDRADLVRAAALHDVGKRHAGLGSIGRVFASLAIRSGLPLHGRFAAYAAHGELAARDLAEIGTPQPIIDFARHHHASRPAGFPPADWSVLQDADRARLPVTRRRAGYPVPDQTP